MPSIPKAVVYSVDPLQSAHVSQTQQLWANALTSNSKKPLDTRVLYPRSADEAVTVLVSLGEDWSGEDDNTKRELVRKATGMGIAKIKEVSQSSGLKDVEIDGNVDAHAAGEFN